MSEVKLTEAIIKELVMNKDDVSVKEISKEDDEEIIIEVIVPESQMGRVIGKGGKTAQAIRTLVQASSYLNSKKRVNINIDSY